MFRDFSELVGDDEFLRGGDGFVELGFEMGEFGGVLAYALAKFVVVGGVCLLDFVERDFFFGVVGGADVFGALEGKVLEHVGETGLAHRVVYVAYVYDGVVGEDGCFGALADDEGESVGEDFGGDVLFEGGEVLGEERGEREQEREEES
jgi:hypothetical protein